MMVYGFHFYIFGDVFRQLLGGSGPMGPGRLDSSRNFGPDDADVHGNQLDLIRSDQICSDLISSGQICSDLLRSDQI